MKNPVKAEIFDKGHTPSKTVIAEPPVKRKKLDRIISKLYEAKNINLSPSNTFNFTTTSSQIHQTSKPVTTVAGASNSTGKLPEQKASEAETCFVIKIENEDEAVTEINPPGSTSPELTPKVEVSSDSNLNVRDAAKSNGQFLTEIINRNSPNVRYICNEVSISIF